MIAIDVLEWPFMNQAFIVSFVAGIVLALGGGVIYFFIVLRSYYMLSRTLEETRDYTRQVIASMADGVLSIDTAGKVVSYNRQALSLLGIPKSSFDRLELQTVFDFGQTGIARTVHQGLPVINREIRYHQDILAPTSEEWDVL